MPQSKPLVATLTLSLLLLTCGNAKAITIDLDATKDNTLYNDGLGNLSNGAGQGFFSGMTGLGVITRGLIAFDVAATVPEGATITDATLTLHHSSPGSNFNETVRLSKLQADWGEANSVASSGGGGGATAAPSDATWLHRFSSTDFWTIAGGDFSGTESASQSVSTPGFYDWSSEQLTSDVQDWLDNPESDFGWILLNIDDGGNDGLAKRFDTRENTVTANRPVLTVEYSLPGGPNADFDDDGDVDGDDLGNWESGFGTDSSGDTNNDGDTDGADFLVWQGEFTGPAGLQTASVPEPTSASLSLVFLALGALNRHRRVWRS